MAALPSNVPSIRFQPPSVDFIDNRSEKYHPAFKKSTAVQYDPGLGRYTYKDFAMATSARTDTLIQGRANEQLPAVRQVPLEVAKMHFWSETFPDAMQRLKEKPPLKIKTEYSIRDATTWKDVYDQLQKARERYNGNEKEFVGKFHRLRRKIMDHSTAIDPITKIAKGIELVSAPMAALEVVLGVNDLEPIQISSSFLTVE